MKRISLALIVVLSFLQSWTIAQTNTAAPAVVLIKAGRLVDVRAGRLVESQGILVEGERIKAVGPLAEIEKSTQIGRASCRERVYGLV